MSSASVSSQFTLQTSPSAASTLCTALADIDADLLRPDKILRLQQLHQTEQNHPTAANEGGAWHEQA